MPHGAMKRSPSEGTRGVPPDPSRPIDLRSNMNLDFHIGIRGVALFGDDANPNTARLRFDPIAAADHIHNGPADGVITLDELHQISLGATRHLGPYGPSPGASPAPDSASLVDYMYLELLPSLVRMREDVTCKALPRFRPPGESVMGP